MPLVYVLQEFNKFILALYVTRIEKVLQQIEKNLRNKDKDLLDSIESFKKHELKKSKMKFLTSTISYLESFFIFTVTILLFYNLDFYTERIFMLLQVIGGYVGIKTIGSFGQWNDKYLGRTSFYLFLLGTIINIILSVAIGIALLCLAEELFPKMIYVVYY